MEEKKKVMKLLATNPKMEMGEKIIKVLMYTYVSI